MKTQIHKIYKNINNIRRKYKKDYIKIKRSKKSHNINKFHKGDKITREIWDIMNKMSVITKYEKDEIYNNRKSNKIYNILVADNKIKIELFCIYLVIFEHRSNLRSIYFNNSNKKTHVGIDYEFNNREIALMQISLEGIQKSYIWIVNPDELNNRQHDILINSLMINKKIYKILHGPESLDIPYMYNNMFDNNKRYILDFTSKLFDTRFLCEYFKISTDEDEKCTIYNALHYFNTISKNKLKYLERGHEKMGHVKDISWDIHNLDKYYLEYALYDVLFLQQYLYDIFDNISHHTPEYANTYRYIIPMMRFVFCERRDVTTISAQAKNITDPLNNYVVKNITKGHKSKDMKLLEIYNNLIENFFIQNHDIDVDFMLSVGYFKKSVTPLFKHVIYNIIFKRYDVYKNIDEKAKNILSLDKTYYSLRYNGYTTVHDLLHLFENEALNKIITLYR